MEPSTPPLPIQRHEADTIKKSRFFHAIDNRASNVTIKDVCEAKNIKHTTGKKWLKMRKRIDDAASRRTDKHRRGRPKKVSPELMNKMLDPRKNLVRDHPWETQIEHFQINVERRTLQRAFHNRIPRVTRFKKGRIRTLSQKNKSLRIQYGKDHQHHTIDDYWQYVHFTNEAHFDPSQTFEERVLREEGTRYESENLQKMPDMKGVKLHVAASIS